MPSSLNPIAKRSLLSRLHKSEINQGRPPIRASSADQTAFTSGALPAQVGGWLARCVRKIYSSDLRVQWALFAIMLICYGFLLAISLRMALTDPMRLTFNSMLHHLLHWQFDVDPQIVGYEGYPFNGRVYAYWGIFPALLRLPLWLVGRLDLDITVWSCFAAVCLAAMAKVRAVLLVRKRALPNPAANLAIVLMLAYILLGGSEVAYLKISVYQEVILWTAAFGAVFVCLAVGGLVDRHFRTGTLCWMALCAGLSLLTRATSGIGLVLALALLLIVLAIQPLVAEAQARVGPGRRLVRAFIQRRFLLPGVILVALVLASGAVNYFRWGNPFAFAPYSQFCDTCTNSLARLLFSELANLKRIPFALLYYFCPVWVLHGSNGHLLFEGTQLRLFEDVELPPSSFFLTDLLPICFISFLVVAMWKRRTGGLHAARRWAAAVATGLLAPCFLMLTLVWLDYRYRMEFYPEIDFLAFLGLYLTITDPTILASFVRLRKWLVSALVVSILSSFMAVALYIISDFGPPQESLRAGVVNYYSRSVAEHYHKIIARHFRRN